MTDFYFQTHSLQVGYNGKTLIHDISVSIEKGEIVALIGPNGAGKSTILKSITRQLKMLGGTVTIDKTDLTALSHHILSTKMAVVLTERMKPELMTCWDIVSTGRYPYTGRLGILTEEDNRKVRAAMESVNAFELADRDFNAISDGQRQRILLARAICQEPEIIILDEPTSFLDIRHKLDLLSILRHMAKEKGITIIMSLHEIDLAQKIADKIMCVKGETISRYGAPDEVFSEEFIQGLYEIEHGYFDPMFGSLELPKPEGEPEVMILSACGSGIPYYRRCQKENTPFHAGILYTNDTDYRLARLLASEVIGQEPFCDIDDQTFAQAVEAMKKVRRVINAGFPVGSCNRRMQDLLDLAKQLNKL